MSNFKGEIILVKAEWCGHCIHFTPIFKKVIELSKNNNFFKNIKIAEYEVEKKNSNDISELNKLKIEHPYLIDKVQGYPTIFIIIEKDGKKIIDTINQTFIEKDDDKEEIKKAAEDFLQNAENKIKTMYSDNKTTYEPQNGGGKFINNHQTSNDEIIFRKKYLKYKSKYIELQNKLI